MRLGLTYPLDEQIATEFVRQCGRVVVIEPRRAFVQRQLQEILWSLRQDDPSPGPPVYGKRFPDRLLPIPTCGRLDPTTLIQRLLPLVRQHMALPNPPGAALLSERIDLSAAAERAEVTLPDRTPVFCPGCPHRDASSTLLALRRDLRDPQYMLQTHKRKPLDLVVHGDGGCHALLAFDPYKTLVHTFAGRAQAAAAAAGADPFIENKQVVFIGDGAFSAAAKS